MTPSAGGVLSLKQTMDTSSMKNASQRCLKSVFLLIEALYCHTKQMKNMSSFISTITNKRICHIVIAVLE